MFGINAPFWASVLIFTGLLALPPALRDRSWISFLSAFAKLNLGVVLPMLVFLASAFLTPEAKSASSHGWIECFHQGKLLLTPLALYASTALYALHVYRIENDKQVWLIAGILTGAILASVCFVFGIYVMHDFGKDGIILGFLAVPGYLAVWYIYAAVRLIRKHQLGAKFWAWFVLGQQPLWWGSLYWSHSIYNDLPDYPSHCFVVTAATRGHRILVGPLLHIQHRNDLRPASRQLAILWAFEAHWQTQAPHCHALFRKHYNRYGPQLANRITTAWRADLVYLMIKPIELIACLFLMLWRKDLRN